MNPNYFTPSTPAIEPGDNRAQSAPVLIQTTAGEWHTARFTVYADGEYASVWELIGRDGLQLERGEVVAWFPCAAVPGLFQAAELGITFADRRRLIDRRDTITNAQWSDVERLLRAALAV